MLPLSMYMEKSMLYVGGKPVVRRIVERVREAFPRQLIELVVLNKYLKDFQHEFRDIPPVYFNIVGVPYPEGTVDAYLHSTAAQAANGDPDVLLHYADTVTDLNYNNLELAYHNSSEAIECILAVTKGITHEYSQVDFDAQNRVLDFHEKPNLSAYTWTGIAIFDKNSIATAITDHVYYGSNYGRKMDFGRDIFPIMLNAGKNVRAYPFNGRYADCGNILSYWRLQKEAIEEASKAD